MRNGVQPPFKELFFDTQQDFIEKSCQKNEGVKVMISNFARLIKFDL